MIEELRTFINNDALFVAALAAGAAVASVLVGWLFGALVKTALRPMVARSEKDFDDRLLKIASSGSFQVVVIAGAYVALEIVVWGLALPTPDKTTLGEAYPFATSAIDVALKGLYVVLVAVVLVKAVRAARVGFDWYADRIGAEENKNLSGGIFPLAKKLASVALFALAVVVILSKFDVNISAFIVSLGVGSLAVALAAQETISNMISGVIIGLDRPFRVGDWVKFGDTLTGEVKEIGVRSTKILGLEGKLVIMPNNDALAARVTNFLYPDDKGKVLLDVPAPIGCDAEEAKKIILAAASRHAEVLADPAPVVFLVGFGEYSLNFKLIAAVDKWNKAFPTGAELRMEIYRDFAEAGIPVPAPIREVKITSDDRPPSERAEE